MKDEERSIAEWIAYQRLIGFGRVVIYDNDSRDRTSAIVHQIRNYDDAVQYVAWPDVPGRAPQKAAYQHAIAEISADWIAFFDVDEFLVLQRHRSIDAFLADAPGDAGAIALNWRVFGSNGRVEAGDGLVIERFLHCARRHHPKNRFCKTIVRRSCIGDAGVHLSTLSTGSYVDTSMHRVPSFENGAKMPYVRQKDAQLNHYLLKSWDEFCAKRKRGNAARSPEALDKFSHRGSLEAPPRWNAAIDADNEYWITHDLNLCEDRKAAGMAGAVRSLLRKWDIEPPSGAGGLSISERVRMWKSTIGTVARRL